MATNVVDVLIRLRNEAIGLFALSKLKDALGFVVDQIKEAEDAAAQLDAAFKATGKGLGLTRDSLDQLASKIQETTVFSDDLVKQSEAVLLTFNRVRGEAFERTIQAATDLSARLGGDLTSAVRLLGKALQDPERGVTQLRKAGVALSDSQIELAKNFVAAGETAKAQNLILAEVEKRFKGSAEAARNTLGGALEGLKNSFGDLFEGTKKGTQGAANSINALSKTLNDPKLKEGIDSIIAGLADIVKLLAQLASLAVKGGDALGKSIGDAAVKLMGFVDDNERVNELLRERANLQRLVDKGRNDTGFEAFLNGKGAQKLQIDEQLQLNKIKPEDVKAFLEQRLRVVNAELERARKAQVPEFNPKKDQAAVDTGVDGRAADDEIDAAQKRANQIQEIVITAKRKEKSANEEFLDSLEERTRTATEKQIADFEEVSRALIELREQKLITDKQFDERLGEAQDKLLPEIDISEIRKMFKTVEKQADETSQIVKGAFQQAGASIQASLSDAIQTGKLSFKSLVDVARKAVADILSAIIVSGIKKALASQLSGTGGSGGGSGKTSIIGSIIGAFLGKKASGGLATTPFIAGEEGPEIISPKGSGVNVINKRQLQFMRGGSGGVFAPQTNIQIIERENPERTRNEILQIVALQNARNEERFMSRLARNGILVR